MEVKMFDSFKARNAANVADDFDRGKHIEIVKLPHDIGIRVDVVYRGESWRDAVCELFDSIGDDGDFSGLRNHIMTFCDNGIFNERCWPDSFLEWIVEPTGDSDGGWFIGLSVPKKTEDEEDDVAS